MYEIIWKHGSKRPRVNNWGVRASNLVKEYGTPLYVMDEKLLRDTCNEYYKNFKCDEEGNRVAFAGKAFLTVEMAKLIKEEGLCLDVVSGGELYTAYKAGVPMERIYFHGNNKTLDEIELGVKLGVGRFIVPFHTPWQTYQDIPVHVNYLQ